jgi:antitoxin PrlF
LGGLIMSEKGILNVTSKITSKNQITIPKAVRETLHVSSSDEINFIINTNTNKVSIVNAKSDFWNMVFNQEKEYENLSTPELDWGDDIESEDF